jgi:hypothetical protein
MIAISARLRGNLRLRRDRGIAAAQIPVHVGFLVGTFGPAIIGLQKHGIAVKVLTGDNELVSRKIGREVGLSLETVLTGAKVEALGDGRDRAVHSSHWPDQFHLRLYDICNHVACV